MQPVNDTPTNETERKTVQVPLKVTPTMFNILVETARTRGLSPQDYIRCLIATNAGGMQPNVHLCAS